MHKDELSPAQLPQLPFIPLNKRMNLWHRFKKILFGQLIRGGRDEKVQNLDELPALSTSMSSNLKDWLKALDTLSSLAHVIRDELEIVNLTKFDLELLGANTYLYHLDRLLVKLKEHFHTFQYRQDQFDRELGLLDKKEFFQVHEAGISCYETMLKLTHLMKVLTRKQLYSDPFITQIHSLESEITHMANMLRALNQWAYRQEAIYQITTLEKNLFQALTSLPKPSSKPSTNALMAPAPGLFYSPSEYLRSLIPQIVHEEQIDMVKELIQGYETLKKCYVVAQKGTVKETLDIIFDNIKGLIDGLCVSEINKTALFKNLQMIFNAIESLRFSANRDSRCSRHLFDKAKAVKHEIRAACLANSLGHEFLQGIIVKRMSLIKKGT